MKRYRTVILAVVLLIVAAVVLQYLAGEKSLYGLLLSPLLMIRSMYWKVGLKRILAILAVALIPVFLRRRARILMLLGLRRVRARVRLQVLRIKRVWRVLPVWFVTFLGMMFVIIVVAAAYLTGSAVWLIALVPLLLKTTIGIAITRWLAHSVATRGLVQIAPVVFRLLPDRIEFWFYARYRRLWWWTMRRLVRNRRRIEERVRLRRLHRSPPQSGADAAGTPDRA